MKFIFILASLFGMLASLLCADTKATIGLTDLWARKPSLKGTGIHIAQVEAGTAYQPNPAAASQPASKFTFFDTDNPYPTGAAYNSAKQSGHANTVANFYYDLNTGVATEVTPISIFSANYFFNNIINENSPPDIGAKIINQSFVFTNLTEGQTAQIAQSYDNYADSYGILFVNGLNNGSSTAIPVPASAYNCIAVGREDLYHSTGPVSDSDPRSKPDIIAPGSATSYATPLVSGCAALLMQAAADEDGGTGTASDAADPRIIKALLLNGAVKDVNWKHSDTAPLDIRRGAGLLNINRSHHQLEGGEHAPTTSVSYSGSGIHPPDSNVTGTVSSRIGWNFSTITNSGSYFSKKDQGDNYYFSLPASTSSFFDVSITLIWNRQDGKSDINNLDLFLFNKSTGSVVAKSVSTVDNVEHIYLTHLSAGDYVVQVMKPESGRVSNSETYGLAFNFSVPAPTAPDSLVATTSSSSSITLNWTDNSNNETNFELQRSLSPNVNFNTVSVFSANTTSYTDTGLASTKKYYYRVKATNSNGDSFYSNISNATTWNDLENWRNTYFGTIDNSGHAADSADPDYDGICNLMEYALGSNPTTGVASDGAAALPLTSIIHISNSDYLQITVHRTSKKSDLTYIIQSSNDLITWGSDVTILEDTSTLLRARCNTPISNNSPQFLRLKITRP